MTKLSRILKDYHESGSVNGLVTVLEAIDDRVFRTKSGDLLVILATRGVDYECLDPAQLQQITHRFESAARMFDQNFRFYQYLLKRDSPSIPHRAYENPVVRTAVENRTAYLQGKASKLYSLEIYYALVYEWSSQSKRSPDKLSSFLRNPLRGMREALSTRSQIAILDDELDRAREILNNKVTSFIVQLQDTLQVDVLDKQGAFHFFRRLLNYTPYKADTVRLKYDQFVDFQACDSTLECHRDHLRLDDYYVEVLTLKVPPARSFAHILRGLQEIPCNYIIASE